MTKCPYCGNFNCQWITHSDDKYNGHWKCLFCEAIFAHEWRYDHDLKMVVRNHGD